MLRCIIFMIIRCEWSINNNKCLLCNKVSITELKLYIVKGTTPVKIVFLRHVTSSIYKVKYEIMNSTTCVEVFNC